MSAHSAPLQRCSAQNSWNGITALHCAHCTHDSKTLVIFQALQQVSFANAPQGLEDLGHLAVKESLKQPSRPNPSRCSLSIVSQTFDGKHELERAYITSQMSLSSFVPSAALCSFLHCLLLSSRCRFCNFYYMIYILCRRESEAPQTAI